MTRETDRRPEAAVRDQCEISDEVVEVYPNGVERVARVCITHGDLDNCPQSMFFTTDELYGAVDEETGETYLFPVLATIPTVVLGTDDATGTSPADLMPDEWGRCEYHDAGYVDRETLTYCRNGLRCDECGPCRHLDCQ